ncbi:MAG: hypothetical protein JNJ54_09015 [Myxococcaceae bacterium]|nr:hypothetical protein [Myxococcaceae bacterium]
MRAFEKIIAALKSGADPRPEMSAALGVLEACGPDGMNSALDELDGLIRSLPMESGGPLALLGGALIEAGAAPMRLPPAVFDRLLGFLEQIPRGDEGDFELPEAYFLYERAAMACLSRSVELRRTLPHKQRLLARCTRYSERYGFLGKMLLTLDDEPLIVVHGATRRAWRFRLSGVADNFQLHTLIRAALAGSGPDRIAGEPPSREVADSAAGGRISSAMASSDWQLACWAGLRPDGGVGESEHWIWNEGVPADIEVLGGERIVLVGMPSIHRSWNAQRVFSAMAGVLEPKGQLSPAEADALLLAIRAAQPS